MQKAAIVIGVNKTGNLPVLSAAVSGARSVAGWLTKEGFHVQLLVDDGKPVVVKDIFDAVEKLVDKGTLEQLVVFFSGHGFLNNSSEHWMLSGAPNNANEAVSLAESVLLARECGIENVVFISDACRSTPASLRAERVRGSVVFPNLEAAGNVEPEVDRFLASLPGEPALEMAVNESTAQYEGIFTTCFLTAFREPDSGMVREITEAGNTIAVVPNRRLKAYLKREVDKRAQAKSIRLRQLPRSIVEAGGDVYIGRALSRPSAPSDPIRFGGPSPSQPPTVGMSDVARMELARAANVGVSPPPWEVQAIENTADRSTFDASVRLAEQALGPGHFETEMGFSVAGAEVASVVGLGIDVELLAHGGAGDPAIIRLHRTQESMGSVIFRFADGGGTVLAGLEGYIGTVVVDEGRVVNVSYVPSDNSWRWSAYEQQRVRLDRLRAVVAASARFGVFEVDRDNAGAVADQIRLLKGVDPTLGLYSTYAYSDAGLRRKIRSVQVYMRDDLSGDLFDVAMLAGELSQSPLGSRVAPFCPMLSQGWSLLRVTGARVSDAVSEAAYHLRPALWTTFDREGMGIIMQAFQEDSLK